MKNISNTLAFKYKIFLPVEILFHSLLKLKNFDIVHIHEIFTIPFLIVGSLSALFKIPYVVTSHGTLDNYHLSHRKYWKNMFFKLGGISILRNAKAYIAVSQDEITDYQKLGIQRSKIYHIPNGINQSELNRSKNELAIRKKYNISSSDKVLTYIGRISNLKGLDLLVNALAKIIKKYPTKLFIVGPDDGYKKDLQKIISDLNLKSSAIFTGLLTGKNKNDLLSLTDIFIYPSPSEGFSLAILEAMAMGIPIVATFGAKFPEIAEFQAGILCQPDAESLYKSIYSLLQNPSKISAYGRNAKKLVEKKFTDRVFAKKTEKVYKEII